METDIDTEIKKLRGEYRTANDTVNTSTRTIGLLSASLLFAIGMIGASIAEMSSEESGIVFLIFCALGGLIIHWITKKVLDLTTYYTKRERISDQIDTAQSIKQTQAQTVATSNTGP